MTSPAELEAEVARLRAELDQDHAEIARLGELLGLSDQGAVSEPVAWTPTLFPVESTSVGSASAVVDRLSSREAKVALFRSLFVGRDDVYALRWENERTGKAGWSPAVRGGWANARRTDRDYLTLTTAVLEAHLGGDVHVGVYPLLRGDACRLLACDFDGPGWALDALAYLHAARAAGVPAALERSRSGDGGHVWVFFSGPVPAAVARRIGVYLLREAMTARAEIDLVSYDRLFPAQDFMPKGSFGNLIAVPLNGECRKRGTTVFLDPASLLPFDDQWAFLSGLARLEPADASEMARHLGEIAIGPDSSIRVRTRVAGPKPPESIRAAGSATLVIDRIGVPPALLSALKHVASLHNPEFYEKERLRLSTWKTPRFIRCYSETLDGLVLPRGLREKAIQLVADAGSRLDITDCHPEPRMIDVRLVAGLRPEQQVAVDALAPCALATLVAPPGAGKTVIACALIAHHQESTLIIVDRKPLVEQWHDRLVTHLELGGEVVGQIGGGRNRPSGQIDIAMVQSLAKRDDLAELTAGYGLIVVDECHHVPAVTFERAVRSVPARRWLGLTATPYRRDGLQALMAMHCGPVRHRMAQVTGGALAALDLVVHPTKHLAADAGLHIQEVFRGLVEDDERTDAICADIAVASAAGRNCLVLSRWTEHLNRIVDRLRRDDVDSLLLHGGMGTKARAAVTGRLAGTQPGDGVVLAATASLLGEGFDCPALDTLFLAFPIRFKGSVVQCVGRVLRPTETKIRIDVHDYVDIDVPVLARMHQERRTAYASLGFRLPAR